MKPRQRIKKRSKIGNQDREPRQRTKTGNLNRKPRLKIKTGNKYREPRLRTKTKNRVQLIGKDKKGEKRETKVCTVSTFEKTVSPLKKIRVKKN